MQNQNPEHGGKEGWEKVFHDIIELLAILGLTLQTLRLLFKCLYSFRHHEWDLLLPLAGHILTIIVGKTEDTQSLLKAMEEDSPRSDYDLTQCVIVT